MLKRFVGKIENPLSQVVKRVAELEEHALSGSYHKIIRTNIQLTRKMLDFCWRVVILF